MFNKSRTALCLSLALLAGGTLTACSQTGDLTSKQVSKKQVSAKPDAIDSIVKSANDSREYESVVLANDLEVVLISDPTIEKSAAALSVGVGSYQEPKGFGGLAHYLEHMLFLGTKSYPTVGEYSEFITQNGGSQNAYTELDHTNYMVAVNNDAYDEALKRFSGFFYESVLDPKYADKERNAVHSEWTMKGPNDYVILGQLDGKTLNQEHPISQFNWGNLESLSDKENQTLQEVLVDFYNKYYSANIMKATMISNLPIAEMKKLAKKHFGKIENKGIPKPSIKAPVAEKGSLQKLVRYVPQTEMKELQVRFVIENNSDQFAVKPNYFVKYLLHNEMPGSLAVTLREMGLTDNLYTSSNASEYGNAGRFSIHASLTEKGLKHRDEVAGLIFKYIEQVKAKGVDEKYFHEIKQSLSNNFRFKEKVNDYSYAMNIAATMQNSPVNYVLSRNFEYQRFNADAINKVLNQLTLENARVLYIDKDQETDTNMHFFKGKYKVEPITSDLFAKWQKAAEGVALKLPSPNTLMPESFDLVAKAHTEKPVSLINEKGLSLHLGHSKNFEQPKGNFFVNFNSGHDKASPRNAVIAALLSKGLDLSLTTLKNEASVAGMWLGVGSFNGLILTAGGFTDKQEKLLEKAYQQVLSYEMTEGELDNLKASYVSNIKSKGRQILINQLFGNFNKVVNLDQYSDESLLAEVDAITVADISQFRDELFKLAKMNAFAFGNYTDKEAKDLARYMEGLLPKDREISDIYLTQSLKPSQGRVYNWQKDTEMTDIAFTEISFNDYDVKQHAAAKMLNRLLRPALFKQLRTEEQLAYTVGFFNQAMREQLIMGFYIQSPAKGPAAIAERIDDFKSNFSKQLKEITAEQLETVRKSEIIGLTQPPKNLREEAAPFKSDWQEQKLDFDSRAKLIAAIKEVSMDDITSLYQALISGEKFGRVVLQMRGTKFAEEPYAEYESAEQVTDINELHQAELDK